MNVAQFAQIYLDQFLAARQMTYDYLDVLTQENLALRLPFPESQTLLSQFRCMLGAQESYQQELEFGSWQGFSSSLDLHIGEVTPQSIKHLMQETDAQTKDLLGRINLMKKLENGKFGYQVVQTLIEHELHHQGQLINFLYAHNFTIPDSWYKKWDLSRD